MSSDGSVTNWIGQLQAGDPAAAQQLWERYFRRLVGLARKKLQGTPRRAADEEDVALSAFDSLCRNAAQGRFPRLLDRDSLWRLMVVLTARKASHQVRDERRQKRGAGVASCSQPPQDEDDEPILQQVLSREPSPEFAAQMAEQCQRLLKALGDPTLESIALLRMEEFTVEEIAAKLGYAPRSIKRKVSLIRAAWTREVAP